MSDVEKWQPEVDIVPDSDVSVVDEIEPSGIRHRIISSEKVGRLVFEEHEIIIPISLPRPRPRRPRLAVPASGNHSLEELQDEVGEALRQISGVIDARVIDKD